MSLEEKVDRMLRERGITALKSEPYYNDCGPRVPGTVLKLQGEEVYAQSADPLLYVFTTEELDAFLIRTDAVGAVDDACEQFTDVLTMTGYPITSAHVERAKKQVIDRLVARLKAPDAS